MRVLADAPGAVGPPTTLGATGPRVGCRDQPGRSWHSGVVSTRTLAAVTAVVAVALGVATLARVLTDRPAADQGSVTGAVRAMASRFCIGTPTGAGRCFGASPAQVSQVYLGECVTVVYLPVRSERESLAAGVLPVDAAPDCPSTAARPLEYPTPAPSLRLALGPLAGEGPDAFPLPATSHAYQVTFACVRGQFATVTVGTELLRVRCDGALWADTFSASAGQMVTVGAGSPELWELMVQSD